MSNKIIKLMENGKDLFEIEFNFSSENTKIHVVKDPSYGSEGYILKSTISVDNEKYKQSFKIAQSEMIKKQFAIYLGMNLGIGFNHFNTLAFDDSKRSSKGVKEIIFKFYFTNPALAWALGCDITEYNPHTKVELSNDTLGKMAECERLVLEGKEYRMQLDMECRQLANIKNVDESELWKEDPRFGEAWKEKIKELSGKRIALYKFHN